MDLALLLALPLVAWAMVSARHRKRLAALSEQRQLLVDDERLMRALRQGGRKS